MLGFILAVTPGRQVGVCVLMMGCHTILNLEQKASSTCTFCTTSPYRLCVCVWVGEGGWELTKVAGTHPAAGVSSSAPIMVHTV